MLTAARIGEIIGATWSEFDLEQRTWLVPAERMKAGEPHLVFLSDRAMAILEALKGLYPQWLFPSPILADKPISNMAMLEMLGRLKMRDRPPRSRQSEGRLQPR